jgi:hypothetical protein
LENVSLDTDRRRDIRTSRLSLGPHRSPCPHLSSTPAAGLPPISPYRVTVFPVSGSKPTQISYPTPYPVLQQGESMAPNICTYVLFCTCTRTRSKVVSLKPSLEKRSMWESRASSLKVARKWKSLVLGCSCSQR